MNAKEVFQSSKYFAKFTGFVLTAITPRDRAGVTNRASGLPFILRQCDAPPIPANKVNLMWRGRNLDCKRYLPIYWLQLGAAHVLVRQSRQLNAVAFQGLQN